MTEPGIRFGSSPPNDSAEVTIQEQDATPRPDLKAIIVIDENGDIDDIIIVEVI